MIAGSLITMFTKNAYGVMQHNYTYSIETYTNNMYTRYNIDNSYIKSLYAELLATYTNALTREIQDYAPSFIPPLADDLELCLSHLIDISPVVVKTFLKERLTLDLVVDLEHTILFVDSL